MELSNDHGSWNLKLLLLAMLVGLVALSNCGKSVESQTMLLSLEWIWRSNCIKKCSKRKIVAGKFRMCYKFKFLL